MGRHDPSSLTGSHGLLLPVLLHTDQWRGHRVGREFAPPGSAVALVQLSLRVQRHLPGGRRGVRSDSVSRTRNGSRQFSRAGRSATCTAARRPGSPGAHRCGHGRAAPVALRPRTDAPGEILTAVAIRPRRRRHRGRKRGLGVGRGGDGLPRDGRRAALLRAGRTAVALSHAGHVTLHVIAFNGFTVGLGPLVGRLMKRPTPGVLLVTGLAVGGAGANPSSSQPLPGLHRPRRGGCGPPCRASVSNRPWLP
ncbi:hypothetical protein QF027_009104 [Streptomyces canus]|nr:hypothetical protein [Streptomyces canus]